MSRKYTKSGFSLIELLVVIAIITVLVSLSTVGYGSIQRKAKKQQSLSIARDLVNAINDYHNLYNHFPPPVKSVLDPEFSIESNSTEMTELLSHLTGVDSSDNTEAKNFLNMNDAKDGKGGLTRAADDSPEFVLDAYANPYTLTFNSSYDRDGIAIPTGYEDANYDPDTSIGDQKVISKVIIYNSGRDQQVGNLDDIVSW